MTKRSMQLGDTFEMPDGGTWRVVYFHDEPNSGLCTLERQDITRFHVSLPVSWVEAIAHPARMVAAARLVCPDHCGKGKALIGTEGSERRFHEDDDGNWLVCPAIAIWRSPEVSKP